MISGVTYRYLFDVVGSTDAHTLQVLFYWESASTPLSVLTYNFNVNNILYGCFNASNLSSNGTTLSATVSNYCATNFGIANQYGGSTFYISGASDSSLNGNCANVTFSSSNQFTCTNSALTGTHTAASATVQLSQSGMNGLGAVYLRPMASVLDVQDYNAVNCAAINLSTPCVDGALTLEPNGMTIAANDTLEEPHFVTSSFQGETVYDLSINPFNRGAALAVNIGNHAAGGGLSTVSNAELSLGHGTPDALYAGLGGTLIPPNGVNISGAFDFGLDFGHAPAPGGALITVFPTASQSGNVNFCYPVFQAYHLGNLTGSMQDCPNNGNETWATNGAIAINATGAATYTAAGHTFNGPATFNGSATFNGNGNSIANMSLGTTGGLISGQGYNYAPNSNTLTASDMGERCWIRDGDVRHNG